MGELKTGRPSGNPRYVVTVRSPQMVRDQKKFGKHCNRVCLVTETACYVHIVLALRLPRVTLLYTTQRRI